MKTTMKFFLIYVLTYDIMFSIHSQNLNLKFNSYVEKKREILLEGRLDELELLRE
jgi:hypothetical protein